MTHAIDRLHEWAEKHQAILFRALVLGAVVNLVMLPHPGWVWAAGIVLPAACGYLGGLLARRPAAGTPAGGAVTAQG